MRYLFDRQFFQDNQKVLLFFANTRIGRWFFRIHGNRSSVKGKILKIEPNAITWKEEKFKTEFVMECRTHNKFSKRLFYGLYPVWYLCHIWDTLIANRWFPEWNLGYDTLTVYPDAHTESTSVDGYIQQGYVLSGGQSWATIVAAAGITSWDSNATNPFAKIESDNITDKWTCLGRSIFLFDTSSLGGTVVSSGIISLFGNQEADSFTTPIAPDINIYSSAPASNTALAAGDFDSLGSTAFSTAITYANFSTSGYNNFTLNASGLAAIIQDGISKFGARNANYDAAISAPNWESSQQAYFAGYFADQLGINYDPKLVVAYNVSASPSASPSVSLSLSPSKSPSISVSASPSVSPSASISPSVSPSTSPSASISPSISPSVSVSASPSVVSSFSPSVSLSLSPSISPSVSISVSPSASPSASISPSISPSISVSASPSTSPSASISPSISPSLSPSESPLLALKPKIRISKIKPRIKTI